MQRATHAAVFPFDLSVRVGSRVEQRLYRARVVVGRRAAAVERVKQRGFSRPVDDVHELPIRIRDVLEVVEHSGSRERIMFFLPDGSLHSCDPIA